VSLLNSVPEVSHLIANNEDEFVNLAIKLSENYEELNNLRSNLRDYFLKSRMCNRGDYMSGVHEAFRTMWNSFLSK
jgi:predicted O-linked N-acetylglucosamine transferase (SPINDLY family)